MIDVIGASKSHVGRTVLHPISLRFPAGQVAALIGPSGCGKTTLLKMMLGLLSPDDGQIIFDGTPVTPNTVRAIRLRIGYVVQDGGLFPHLSARENTTLVARQLGRPKDAITSRLNELAALVRLPTDALDRYPAQLSGGQRQRVGLMRALMLDPPALLMDEPMGALDPLVRADLQADLKAVFRELGKTVVLVTHDLNEAAALGDRVILMRDGRVVQDGTMSELEATPSDPFVTRFIQVHRGVPA